MGARICPRCGKVVRGTCPRCGPAWRRTKGQEAARKGSNPWRSHYSSAAYRRACQEALEATGGRCAATGARIADWDGRRWRMRPGAGGVHHVVPLSRGGTDDASNLVPLSVAAHNALHGEMRREGR